MHPYCMELMPGRGFVTAVAVALLLLGPHHPDRAAAVAAPVQRTYRCVTWQDQQRRRHAKEVKVSSAIVVHTNHVVQTA